MTDTLLERPPDTPAPRGDTLEQPRDADDVWIAPSPDQVDPDYALRGPLGAGGMAVVWLAEQLPLAREVAVKCARDGDDAEASMLLLREATITGQLEHPNIVPVHALISVRDGPAVVMKRLTGDTWDVLIRRGELSLERHLDIFTQVLNAVAFAHSRGVLHRDIKPSNVMIGEFGEVYLLDWGVARREGDPESDAIVGTPCYLAPEMAEGKADERTDVFLLGATLHEVLTLEPRHRGLTPLELLYHAMHVEPYPYRDVPEELAAICNRACARDPSARFASVNALRAAVAAFREHRAAWALSEAAEAELTQLVRAVDDRSVGDAAVQQRFVQARFGFETALRQWPESPEALAGLTR
ncbi:MAG TPA: serine/threonine-protein kinase, partial [Polyangiales bacterium]